MLQCICAFRCACYRSGAIFGHLLESQSVVSYVACHPTRLRTEEEHVEYLVRPGRSIEGVSLGSFRLFGHIRQIVSTHLVRTHCHPDPDMERIALRSLGGMSAFISLALTWRGAVLQRPIGLAGRAERKTGRAGAQRNAILCQACPLVRSRDPPPVVDMWATLLSSSVSRSTARDQLEAFSVKWALVEHHPSAWPILVVLREVVD